MSFSWQRMRGWSPEWLTFADGERYALQARRSRNCPQRIKEEPNVVLLWHGADKHDPLFYWSHYQSLVAGLCERNPQYEPNWNSAIETEIWFNLPAAQGEPQIVGNETLFLGNGLTPTARDMIDATLRRHSADWHIANFMSDRHTQALWLQAPNFPDGEHSVVFRDWAPIPSLPIEALASCIESTGPQLAWEVMIGKDTAETHYGPWPLSHEELVAALEELEQLWKAKPLSRRKLAAVCKEMEAERAAREVACS